MSTTLMVLVLVANLATEQKFRSFVATHPDAQLRQDFATWTASRKIRVKIDLSVPLLGAVMQPLRPGGVPVLTLLVGPGFFVRVVSPSASDRMEAYGEVYHGYIHLREQITRKYPLEVPEAENGTAEAAASYLWGQEYRADLGQWLFLKDHGYGQQFVPGEDVQNAGEWAAFLRQVRLRMQLIAKYVPSFEKFVPYWEQDYQRALTVSSTIGVA